MDGHDNSSLIENLKRGLCFVFLNGPMPMGGTLASFKCNGQMQTELRLNGSCSKQRGKKGGRGGENKINYSKIQPTLVASAV